MVDPSGKQHDVSRRQPTGLVAMRDLDYWDGRLAGRLWAARQASRGYEYRFPDRVRLAKRLNIGIVNERARPLIFDGACLGRGPRFVAGFVQGVNDFTADGHPRSLADRSDRSS